MISADIFPAIPCAAVADGSAAGEMNAGREGARVMIGRDLMKVYTLAPEELEALLLTNFGGRLQPVDGAKLSKLKQQQANSAAYKARFAKPKI